MDYNTQVQLNNYIKRISSFNRISKEKEKELVHLISVSNGKIKEKAVNELVEANLGLVIQAVIKRLSSGIDVMDLIYIGNLALLRAANKYCYTHDSHANFSTYAYTVIRNDINVVHGKFVYLPKKFISLARSIKKFEDDNNKKASVEEIARLLKVSCKSAKRIREGLDIKTCSIEALSPEEGGWEDIIGNNDHTISKSLLKLDLLSFIEQLKPKYREIINLMYFGAELDGPEIGKMLGYTKQNIDHRQKRALIELKSQIIKVWDKENRTKTKIMDGNVFDYYRNNKKTNHRLLRKKIARENKNNKKVYKNILAYYLKNTYE